MSENSTPSRLEEIAARIADGSASDEQMQRYLHWMEAAETSASQTDIPDPYEIEFLLQQRIWQAAGITPVRQVRRPVLHWLAAAAILLVIVTGTWWYLQPGKPSGDQLTNQSQPKHDRMPGGNKAMLRLADGTLVPLDSSANLSFLQQADARLDAGEGQLSYSGHDATIENHELLTPAGGQFQLTLPDGSNVWLNAASSISFPTAFGGQERRVRISGEAYFEVAHDAAKPFKVDIEGKATVTVLGTHFNINAYADDNAIRTTLLEGKVQVETGSSQRQLLPGDQGIVRGAEPVQVRQVNTEGVMAWMNQQFYFDNADIHLLMKELSRWYGVQVEYRNQKTLNHFSGYLPRQARLSEIIKILKLSGIQLELDEKTLIVND